MRLNTLRRWTARLSLGVLVGIGLPFAAGAAPGHAAQPPQTPVLNIQKTHTGDFVRGQQGEYQITVTNTGGVATNNTAITVTENVPAGLELVSMVSAPGSGWLCGGNSCNTLIVYGPGETLPAITVVVNVLPDAPDSVTNEATVSGGGSAPDTVQDPTVITGEVATPVLSISKSHSGNFTQGGTGTYTITVSNASGAGPTTGTVTVTDTFPAGVTPTAASPGAGWSCGIAGQTVTCTSNGALPGGATSPPITVTVDVTTAAPCTFTNTATVSGGGSNSATASDPTTVTGGTCNGGNGGGGGSILPINLNGILPMFNNIAINNNIKSPGASNTTNQSFTKTN